MNIQEAADKTVIWLGTPKGFLMSQTPAYLGIVFAVALRGNQIFMLGFNTILSVATYSIAGLIFINQQAKDAAASQREQALQRKADELIHAIPGADDKIAGIEGACS